MKKYILEITAFVTGASVMILEIVASRIMAPFLGTSIIVWASLIGVVLGSLSLGYYLGGKFADKKATLQSLAKILLVSSFLFGLIAFFKGSVLAFMGKEVPDLRTTSLFASIILFSPVNVALGMVLPYSLKLKIENLKNSGENIGNLVAISTVGSLVGVFLTGYYLLAILGIKNILLLLSALLFLNFVLLSFFQKKIDKPFFLIGLIGLSLFTFKAEESKSLAAEIDTHYNHVQIIKGVDPITKRKAIWLSTGRYFIQTLFYADNLKELADEYKKYYHLAFYFNPDIKKTLMIGGGGFAYPQDYVRKYPEAEIDVVEIDPALKDIAVRFFGFEENPRLKIITMDGRLYLNKNTTIYDAVMIDAFMNAFSVPFQLATKEATQKIYDALSPKGVLIINIISPLEGENSKTLSAVVNTYKEIFPQVYLFPILPDEPLTLQNVMVVAFKDTKVPSFEKKDAAFVKFLDHLYFRTWDDIPALTDDFAPVEQYLLKI